MYTYIGWINSPRAAWVYTTCSRDVSGRGGTYTKILQIKCLVGFSLIISYSKNKQLLGLVLELCLLTWKKIDMSVCFNHSYAGVEIYQDLLLPKINLHTHQGMHWVHGLVSGAMCLWLFCKLMWTCISALGLSLTGTLGCDSEKPCFYFCHFPWLNVWPQSITPLCLSVFTYTMLFSLRRIIKVVKSCLKISVLPQQNTNFFNWFYKLILCEPH